MELALITKFTFIDGLSLILSVLGVILYGTIVYALFFKKNSIHQEKIVLFFGITIFLYFFGNFIAFFAIALAQDYFTNAYKTVIYVPTPKDIKEAYADNGIVYANKYLKSFTSQIYKF